MLISSSMDFRELLENYYRPEEIFNYCAQCHHHGQNHSCPPHEDRVVELFDPESRVSIFAYRIALSDDDDLETAYLKTRQTLDRAIMAFESTHEALALIPGRCLVCDPCLKSQEKPCPYPSRMRYSLETLGFHVSDLMKEQLGMELEWTKPEITFVFAFVMAQDVLHEEFNKFLKAYI